MHNSSSLWPRCVRTGAIVLLAFGIISCNSSSKAPARPVGAFRDAAAETGLNFVHRDGGTGERYMPEMVGAGVALLDYDNDGDLDVFLVQGGNFQPGQLKDDGPSSRPALFRNDLKVNSDGTRSLHFTDVSQRSGIGYLGYGMGVIAGDYDSDGKPDLLVTTLGGNHLLHNQGNGTFQDVTAASGLAGEDAWGTSASWVDIDRDGRPDLFTCSYLVWSFAIHKTCTSRGGGKDYCGPHAFTPARSHLYRNLGDGHFQDISLSSGISTKAGAALGVVAGDFSGDGWPDLLVANDGMENHLWVNRRNRTFAEEALERGLAYNAEGEPAANMGVIAADFANRGLQDIFITHLMSEHATYYRNLGNGQFEDGTAAAGLDAPTRPFTGFGTAAIDFDNDGWLDIFAANGEVRTIEEQVRNKVRVPMRQRAFLFRNRGPAKGFDEVQTGQFLKQEEVGRGVASGDLDNDGKMDLVITNNGGPVRLLLNQTAGTAAWLGARVLLAKAPGSPPLDALGAIVRLERPGEPPQTRAVATDGSYLSSGDPRVLFGLGNSTTAARLVVTWPDGTREAWDNLPAGRYHQLLRGTGHTPDAAR